MAVFSVAASRRRCRGTLLCVAAGALALSACSAFLPSPVVTPARAEAVGSALASGLMFAPLVANAELPPLEDLPLEELSGTMTNYKNMSDNFYGITAPMAFAGIFVAVCWAVFIVNNIVPKKEEEGVYKTYIGAGNLPPEGFTNPLDPRLVEEDADESDPVYQKQKKADKQKSAGSAIV